MSSEKGRRFSHLRWKDRLKIERMLKEGHKVKEIAAALQALDRAQRELEPPAPAPLPRAQLRAALQDPAQDAGALRHFFASILAQIRYARPSRDAPFTLELEFLA